MYEPTLTMIHDSPRFILADRDSDSIQPILATFPNESRFMNHAWQQEHNKIQLTIQYDHQKPLRIRSMRGWAYQRLAKFKLNFYLNKIMDVLKCKSLSSKFTEHIWFWKKYVNVRIFWPFWKKKRSLSKPQRTFKILIHLES